MDQTTAFSPHVYVKTLDGGVHAFARTLIDHWEDVCEQYKAPLVETALAEIDAIPADQLKPVARAAARAEARGMEVPIGAMEWRCRNLPKWIKASLMTAYRRAGGTLDPAAVVNLIPWRDQQEIAYEIATNPVVKNDPKWTAENPLVAGVDFVAKPATPPETNASTGASTSSTSSDTATGSPSAD